MRFAFTLGATCAAILAAGCTTLDYYGQAVGGHLSLLARRVPLARAIDDPETAPEVRARLERARAIRRFASEALALPDNRSYADYVDVGRPFVVWTVVVAPALSLEPERWCFPVVGCVAYRGYHDRSDALGFAERWRARGYDVAVSGVRAYSTLGWLPDPLLSTMLRGPETVLAGLVFHELAHQVVYVPDDTAFNEAFAVAVEREGVRRWLERRGPNPGARDRYARRLCRHARFLDLVSEAREDLAAIYRGAGTEGAKRSAKRRRLEALEHAYGELRRRWGDYAGYDAWFARDLNNAKLALVATYHDHVPAFVRLLERSGGDLERFYAAVAALGARPPAERAAELNRLSTGSESPCDDIVEH